MPSLRMGAQFTPIKSLGSNQRRVKLAWVTSSAPSQQPIVARGGVHDRGRKRQLAKCIWWRTPMRVLAVADQLNKSPANGASYCRLGNWPESGRPRPGTHPHRPTRWTRRCYSPARAPEAPAYRQSILGQSPSAASVERLTGRRTPEGGPRLGQSVRDPCPAQDLPRHFRPVTLARRGSRRPAPVLPSDVSYLLTPWSSRG